ncbi:hypothetical protein ACIBEJ_20265 [Nonomuraea sp. NPDC050790]|uniref:hypothetical protein n=1 Tax=Nonomuraea sp. NPDC050790 TaxID=3364371 RepID=UPI003790B77C
MRVGYGFAELPVPAGTPLGGYIDRPGHSAGTLDPLRVGAVTWFDGERRFALAVADVICVNADLAEHARRAVHRDMLATPPQEAHPTAGVGQAVRSGQAAHPTSGKGQAAGCEVWVAASHTHAGPETGCVPGGGVTPVPWLERVSGAVRAAVRGAVEGERAADGTAHRGELHGVGADRGDPDAARTVPLDVIAVWGDDGLAGVVVVLPVHPTVLPAGNLLVSADLTGAVRAALRARLGEGTWVVVATGAAGNVSTRFTRLGQDAAELDRLGGLVADRCLELLAQPGTRAWTGASRVGNGRALRDLRRARLEADFGSLTGEYERAAAHGDPVAARLARSRLEGVRARALGETAVTDSLSVEVGVARLGALGLVGLPGEPFLEVAESIRDGRGGPLAVLGYVNGYPGYLPTSQAYGRAGYEVLASAVAPGSAESLAEAARQLLEEV